MPETLHSGTPTITVTDNRGLMVRTVQYNREKLDSPLDERITATTYSPAGLVQRQTDPRLFAQSDPSVANFNYGHDLLGHTLWTRSVDAGEHWSVLNSEGQPIAQQDARGTVTRTKYDGLGRLTQASEQLTGHDSIVLTQLTYGDADNHDPEKKAVAQWANLCGVVSHQYDTAGLLTTPGMTVTGQPQAQLRRLLKATQGEADWGAAIPPDLEIDAYTTIWTYNALGQPLTQTDAMGNVQQTTYDVAGRLASVKLKQKQAISFKTLLASIQYSAQGQIEREEAGNGVTTTYTYDPKTHHLNKSVAQDKNGKTRQQLVYEYDPVGNILSIDDQANAPEFFCNQKIEAKATYAYDALYQLVRATGREQTDAQQSSQLPPLIHPPPLGTRTNYTRTYTYDRGGNLIGISGERGSHFKQTMKIAQGSNRLSAVTGSGLQAGNTISNLKYDSNGNPDALGTKVLKDLQWNGRNQLRHVVMLERTGGKPNDEEWYQYDGNGQRIRKTTSTLAKQEDQSRHTDEVIYLPGLQLRRHFNVKKDVAEELHIVIAQAGRAQVRVLHWNKGQPDKIENNQIRYSLDNHLGSSVMELDQKAQLLTYEEYYPYGGTAVWAAKSELKAKYKIIRYSGKERDATGLYYYGFRYYAPWIGRWLNPDPAGAIDGLNLFRMVMNNPIKLNDNDGLSPSIIALYGFGQYRMRHFNTEDDKNKYVTIDEYNSNLWMNENMGLKGYYASLSAIRGDINKFKLNRDDIAKKAENYPGYNKETKDFFECAQIEKAYSWLEHLQKNYEKIDIAKKSTDLFYFAIKNSEDIPMKKENGEFVLNYKHVRHLYGLAKKFSNAENYDELMVGIEANDKKLLEGMVMKAFFRATSKLGLDWFIEGGAAEKVIFTKSNFSGEDVEDEFYKNQPWKLEKVRAMDKSCNGEMTGYAENITYSEIRYALKKYTSNNKLEFRKAN
ncbi:MULTISPECIES: RHS repeat-associated core domain-containing protein [Burkholderiaceae]|uniref:RHS repeat domain-containing protein n=1 Tax=Burkholderiaceae TaxID=119060 RepID=UPI0009690293|nr:MULTISPECIES: RHS repeat-associated core domain-containing protein [Burkholderiaceae]MCG1041028.1 RHS repeat protein [Mycetohabitans sp. B7]SIT64841.1 insecticidal toxin complex protein TccC [Burkholderia sp. b14]